NTMRIPNMEDSCDDPFDTSCDDNLDVDLSSTPTASSETDPARTPAGPRVAREWAVVGRGCGRLPRRCLGRGRATAAHGTPGWVTVRGESTQRVSRCHDDSRLSRAGPENWEPGVCDGPARRRGLDSLWLEASDSGVAVQGAPSRTSGTAEGHAGSPDGLSFRRTRRARVRGGDLG